MANGNVAHHPNTRLYWTFGQFQQDLAALKDQIAQLGGSVPGITGAIDNFHASGDKRLADLIGEVKRIADVAGKGRSDDDRQADDDRLSHLLAWGVVYPSQDVDGKHAVGAVLHDAGYPTVRKLAGRSKSLDAAAAQLEEDIRKAHPTFDISRGFAARIVAAARAIARKTAP
jgi:hypothetical protein